MRRVPMRIADYWWPDMTLIFIACLAAIAVGAGLIFLPAGLIVGGTLGAAAVVVAQRGAVRSGAPE